jgi:hypothetical protein
VSAESRPREGSALRRGIWPVVAVVVLVFAVIMARALWSARGEWESGQRALADGRASLAITYFRRSASWHVPLSPYTERALGMLEHLAQREGSKGRSEAARVATLAQRSAKNAARTLAGSLPTDPNPWFSLLALGGWIGWSGAALSWVTRGLGPDGQFNAHAPRYVAAIVLGMVLFAVGLALA